MGLSGVCVLNAKLVDNQAYSPLPCLLTSELGRRHTCATGLLGLHEGSPRALDPVPSVLILVTVNNSALHGMPYPCGALTRGCI